MKKYCFLLILLLLGIFSNIKAQDVAFVVDAPNTVVKGERFQLQYILKNAKGSGLEVSETINGFDVLYGPSTSTMYSQSIINGKSSSESSTTYTYYVQANEVGDYTLPAAKIKADGKNYTSNTKKIKVLPPDKNAQQSATPGGQTQTIVPQSVGKFNPEDAFIRAIFSKTKIHEQEAVVITFRFYTVLNIEKVGKIEFPEFEGFITEDIELSVNSQLEMEHYNGRNYFSVDVRKTVLFPQRSGKITIPSGKMDITFLVETGEKRYHPLYGSQAVMQSTKNILSSSPITVDVAALSEGKPLGFSGGVGSFAMRSSLSAAKVKANDAVTLKIEISGTGNLKLVKEPVLELDKNLETYDPKINNDFKITANGQSGTKTIEYLFIPRYPGKYTIPAAELSYFDLASKSYKTLKTEEYTLDVDVDPNAGSGSGATSYMNQQEVKVEQDIRYLKTNDFRFSDSLSFVIGKATYPLWYILPLLLFVITAIVYRKQIRANADIARMRTKKASKVATRRLKQANKYLKIHNKDGFYDETLRAVWGYLSDKLTIPVADLNRENVENELLRYGAQEQLVKDYIEIIDTCEFARYAPAESDKAMDKLYDDTVEAIDKMESGIKLK